MQNGWTVFVGQDQSKIADFTLCGFYHNYSTMGFSQSFQVLSPSGYCILKSYYADFFGFELTVLHSFLPL